MKAVEQTREQMETRRDEIKARLNKVNEKEELDLVRNMEDQAIQTEQHEVSVTMEENLQKELAAIEEKLAMMDDE